MTIIGGSHDYAGAPTLSSLAAYRIGAGLVQIAAPRSVQPIIAAHVIEAIFQPQPEREGRLSCEGAGALLNAIGQATAIVYGPGMGRSSETIELTRRLLSGMTGNQYRGSVIDADGLNALAKIPEWWALAPPNLVLTPHPGEMARLTKTAVKDVQSDRIGVALEHAALWNAVVVLKGSGTVVASPDGRAVVNPTGGPNLATAGTGDVLSGSIGGLLAQGCSPWNAAVAGVYIHGLAGDRLRAEHGSAGTLASDLLAQLPIARRQILDDARSSA